MERASAAARVVRPVDVGLLAAAARAAVAAISDGTEPARSIDAAVSVFHGALTGVMPSVFVLEHGRLWLVAQRGYAVVPDGIPVDSGITGRAIRLGRPQLAPDVRADPDYVAALPGVVSELAVPLRSGRSVVGILNVESERALPDGAADALRPLARALAPLAEALRASRTLDLAALARLFVHLGSMREPRDIAALGAASLPKILPVEASHIVVWEELGTPRELAVWRADDASRPALTLDEIARGRMQTDPSVVCQVLDVSTSSTALAAGRVAPAPRPCRRDRRPRRPRSRHGSRGSRSPRHGCGPRGPRRSVPRCRLRSAARAAERRDRLAHRDPEPPRARGAARSRARVRPGTPGPAEPARDRLRRLQGHQRPGRARVRRCTASRGRGRVRPLAAGGRAGRATGGRRVRRHASRRRGGRRRGVGRSDPERPGCRADRRRLPAAHLGGHRDLPLRRREADLVAARRRPGAVRGQERGQGPSRCLP